MIFNEKVDPSFIYDAWVLFLQAAHKRRRAAFSELELLLRQII